MYALIDLNIANRVKVRTIIYDGSDDGDPSMAFEFVISDETDDVFVIDVENMPLMMVRTLTTATRTRTALDVFREKCRIWHIDGAYTFLL